MKYPRLLLLHMSKVHADDPLNLLVRNLFGNWPKENIAQIYTGSYSGNGKFCGQYYKIGTEERRFGRAFGLLKPVGVSIVSGQSVTAPVMKYHMTFVKVLAKRIASIIIDSGLWEVIFRIRCSTALTNYVREFKPDIIYTQGYNIGITKLTLQLAEQFNIPICYFSLDDWQSYLYHWSPIHREVDALATTIAKRASLRLALGPKMCETFTQRYNVDFECIYNADNISRFKEVELEQSGDKAIVFGFTGSLYLGRITCLCDLLRACQSLNIKTNIKIYCMNIPADTPQELLDSKYVEFLPLPSHDELPQALAECDILFLPESFEPVYRKAIELSLSTKSHLYMMSGRPILIYGPEWSGTVDYARRFNWGVVVDKNNLQDLIHGINIVLTPYMAIKFVARNYEVARMNHDITKLRKQILEKMLLTIHNN